MGAEGVVVGPEGVFEVGEAFAEGFEGGPGGALHGAAEGGPFGGDGGEGTEAAVGVVGGAGAGEGPGEGAFGSGFVVGAELPPVLPEGFEVAAGLNGGAFVEIGFEEAGEAEEEGFAGDVGVEVLEDAAGGALPEEGHGQLVGAVAEGAGEGLPEGVLEAVAVFELLELACFSLQAEAGRLGEEVVDAFDGELGEGMAAAAEVAGGAGEDGMIEGFAEALGGDDDTGDFAASGAAGEVGLASAFEDDVEDDGFEGGVRGVAVLFPIGGMGVDLEGAAVEGLVDVDGGVEEVGAGGVVPFAELDDANGLAGGCLKVASEGSGEPEGLQYEFVGEEEGIFGDACPVGADLLEESGVGHGVGGWGRAVFTRTFLSASRNGGTGW